MLPETVVGQIMAQLSRDTAERLRKSCVFRGALASRWEIPNLSPASLSWLLGSSPFHPSILQTDPSNIFLPFPRHGLAEAAPSYEWPPSREGRCCRGAAGDELSWSQESCCVKMADVTRFPKDLWKFYWYSRIEDEMKSNLSQRMGSSITLEATWIS